MTYKNIAYSKRKNIATITLNRPEKMNALSRALLSELDAGLMEAEDDDDVRVVILTGAGRAFCTGYDLTEQTLMRPVTVRKWRARVKRNMDYWFRIWDMTKPVIAAVHGYCLAAGAELTLMCDITIASEDTKFGEPAVRYSGVGPAMIWPMILGLKKAKELHLTGNVIDAKEAERLGMVNKVVPSDKLLDEANAIAETICKVPRDSVALNKAAVNRAFDFMGLRNIIAYASEMTTLSHLAEGADDFFQVAEKEGLKSALGKRDRPFERRK